LLYVEHGKARLISRNGRTMKRFGALAWALVPLIDAHAAILDGEIVVKDTTGRSIFLDLMRRPNDASYVAFDLLWLWCGPSPHDLLPDLRCLACDATP